jgi:hypothetical protein
MIIQTLAGPLDIERLVKRALDPGAEYRIDPRGKQLCDLCGRDERSCKDCLTTHDIRKHGRLQ